MDALTFIATIVRAAVWPAVAGYALWLFRSYLPSALNDLLSRLTSAKAAGVEFSFSKKLDEAEEVLPPHVQTIIAEETKPEVRFGHARVAIGETIFTGEESAEFLNTHEIRNPLPPAYIITQAWLRFEEEVHLYLQFRGIKLEDRRRGASAMLHRLNCVFRRLQPPIPTETSHLFRSKPAEHSDDPSRAAVRVASGVEWA